MKVINALPVSILGKVLIFKVLLLGIGINADATPKEIVPDSVMLELGALNQKFSTLLYQNCQADKCYALGCSYLDHEIVTKKSDVALPGIYTGREVDAALKPQAYLTKAQCEFSYENFLPKDMIADLSGRLSNLLSAGYLGVRVTPKVLAPLHSELTDAANVPQATVKSAKEVMIEKAIESTIPSLPWILGLMVLLFCVLMTIWALRRLGKESVEERILAKQLEAESDIVPEVEIAKEDENEVRAIRIEKSLAKHLKEFQKEPELLQDITDDWLRGKKFREISTAVKYFGGEGLRVFGSNPSLMQKHHEATEFYHLNHAEIALNDAFLAELEKKLAEKRGMGSDPLAVFKDFAASFSPAMISETIEMMPTPMGALTLVLLPSSVTYEVVLALSESIGEALCERLLSNNRMSSHLCLMARDWLSAVMDQRVPISDSELLHRAEGGPELDVSYALSLLLEKLNEPMRQKALKAAISANRGITPPWATKVFHAGVLKTLSPELLNNILLEQDATQLPSWFESLKDPDVKKKIVNNAPTALKAMLTNKSQIQSGTQRDQAMRGLSHSLKRRVDSGEVSIGQIF